MIGLRVLHGITKQIGTREPLRVAQYDFDELLLLI